MSKAFESMSALVAATEDVPVGVPVVRQGCGDRIQINFFFDGTSQNMYSDEQDAWSNVAKLSQIVRGDERDGVYARYITGVGTNLRRKEPSWNLYQYLRDSAAVGGGIGAGAESRLESGTLYMNKALKRALVLADRKISNKLVQECRSDSDEAFDELGRVLEKHRLIESIHVSVFGFSRGAALARAFVNQLLNQCERRDGKLTYQSHPIRFRFAGLFDTVASFGLPARNLFDDVTLWLPSEVERCVHYVAAHELRFAFPVTLIRQSGDYPAGWTETVFPGVHCDIGGGYAPDEQSRGNTLSRIPLAAMLQEAVMAGVPLRDWDDVSTDALLQDMFEIPEQTQNLYDTYMGSLGSGAQTGAVEQRMQAHMKSWYAYQHAVAGGVSPDDARYRAEAASLQGRIDEINAELHAVYLNGINSESATTSRAQVRKLQEERRRLQGELDALNEDKEAVEDGQAKITDEAAALREQRERGEPLVIRKVGAWDHYLFESQAAEPWMLDAYYGPEPSPAVIRFFDTLVHDSKASFLGGNAPWIYFRDRGVMEATPPDTDGEKADTWVGNLIEAGADVVDDLDAGLLSEFW